MFYLLGVLSLIAIAAGPPGSGAGVGDTPEISAPVDRVLQAELARGTAGMARIIVRAKPGRLDDVGAAMQELGGTIVSRHALINALAGRLDLRSLPALLRHPAVASVSSDGPIDLYARPGLAPG